MNKHFIRMVLCAPLLFVLGMATACDSHSPATTTANLETTKISAETTEAPAETAETPGAVNVSIASIYELNDAHEEGSHADLTGTSYLETDFRSRIELPPQGVTRAVTPYYTRVKQLPDGTYILFYNDEQNGKGVRSLTSKDGVTWENYRNVFNSQGDKKYANPDAIVLQNGDLLVCAAWRHTNTYYTDPTKGGISIKRSTDNGKTWGAEQVIFLGINWEPYFLQLRSGELQIYWTNTTNHILPSGNNQSTGTAILRSFDNGYTWTGDTSVPYSGQVVAKQATENYDGVQFYTDQMPVAVELQNGTIALALESRLNRKRTYRITMAYSDDNWAEAIPADGEGPEDKFTNLFVGTAPYIRQFPSGEVLLRHSLAATSTLRLADPTGHIFSEEIVQLENMRGWGNIELIDNMHTALVCSTARYNEGEINEVHKINLQKVNLNHALFAKSAKNIKIDGDNSDWSENKDALFVGSKSQAQAAFRFARDEDRLCVLIDRLDYDLTDKDTVTVRIALPESKRSYIFIAVSPSGIVSQYLIKKDGTKIALDCKCA
ncbi:MAG: exo-alpha-sialidase, partial [Clostridia bacterium]|nr:exo-alpha-sialidase [Clostridia bacterium]